MQTCAGMCSAASRGVTKSGKRPRILPGSDGGTPRGARTGRSNEKACSSHARRDLGEPVPRVSRSTQAEREKPTNQREYIW